MNVVLVSPDALFGPPILHVDYWRVSAHSRNAARAVTASAPPAMLKRLIDLAFAVLPDTTKPSKNH